MAEGHPESEQEPAKAGAGFGAIPAQADEPVVWDPNQRRFVPRPADPERPQPAGNGKPVAPAPAQGRDVDGRRFFVGPDAVGKAPPPRKQPGPPTAAAALAAAPSWSPPAAPPGPPPPPAAPPAAPPGVPRPAPKPPRRRRRLRRPKLRRLLLLLPLLPLLLGAAGLLWANWKFNQIERVEVGHVLSPGGGGGTNYLIVGSDSRENVNADDPNAGSMLGEGAPGGQRSDTIMLLRVEGDRSLMMSIPRDLFVTIAGTGEESRINAAYNQGPVALIQTVSDNLGIPIHRYLEVDFVTFAGLVDALGGVTIDFPNPAFDDDSGLYADQAGPVTLDGTQALAYVRSRNYVEVVNGENVPDPTGDLGRVVRQQQFLRAVMGKAGGSRNPVTLMRVASAVAGGIRIDDKMSLFDALRLAWRMGKLDPESVELPTIGFRTAGGAAVLGLVEDEAPAVLDQFR